MNRSVPVIRLRRTGKFRFPLREGNRFHLLVDGGEFFPAMFEAIERAQRYVLMEMYLFESGEIADRFIEAFRAAAARGVGVYLLLDDFGAFQLRRKDRQRLQDGGVTTVFYNPLRFGRWLLNLPRNHRKLLLVDGAVAFTGGAGISDQFDPSVRPDVYWHETMLQIEGPCVGDWQQLFQDNWDRWAAEPLSLPSMRPAAAGERSGRVVVHPQVRSRSEIMRSFVNNVRRAERRVWMATAYFIPSWKLRRRLRKAARSGLDVRLLLPGPHTDNPPVRLLGRRYYGKFLRDGVRIFEYQPRFLHAKLFLCDNLVSIGSSNLDHWNHRWNLEANQEVQDPEVLERVELLFDVDFKSSREISHGEWLLRPWRQRIAEHVLGGILALTLRIQERRPPRSQRKS